MNSFHEQEPRSGLLISTVVLCALVLMIVAGCGSKSTDYPDRLTQTEGNLTAALQVSPYPPAPMQNATLTLSLRSAGRPVSGAAPSLVITMLNCTMAPDNPTVSEHEAGVYQSQTLFTMSGSYKINATVLLAGESHVFTFYITTR